MRTEIIQERITFFLFFFRYSFLSTSYSFPRHEDYFDFHNSLAKPSFVGPHPIPDIPVIGTFEREGKAVVLVEVDPRCFAEDPEEVALLLKEAYDKLSDQEREKLKDQVNTLMENTLRARFGPEEWFFPDFRFDFLTKEHETIILEEDIVVLWGTYERTLSQDLRTYQIKALDSADYDLIFTNVVNGKPLRRVNVLWPGEESLQRSTSPSYSKDEKTTLALEHQNGNHANDTLSTFYSFLRKGFVHVLPDGLDHVLFVIGLFLFSRKAKPLLLQVTAFTIAHTITIALASLNFIVISPSIVEPLIALSIALLAVENALQRKFALVFSFRLATIFIFGLIHGLGFAGVSSLNPESPSLSPNSLDLPSG